MPYSAKGLAVAALLTTSLCRCQITSINSDRHYIVGARAAALGDAFVADDQDVSGMYHNPASLSFLRMHSVVLNVGAERIGDNSYTMVENVVLPVQVNRLVCLGLGASFSHIGKTSEGDSGSGLNFKQYGIDVSVSYLVSRSLGIGASVNGKYGRTPVLDMGFITSSIGVFYMPELGLSYGLVLQGLGWEPEYTVVNGRSLVARTTQDKSIQIGVGLRLPKTAPRPTLSLSYASQKLLNRKGVVYKGGFEMFVWDFLAFRVGYWFGPNSVAAKYGGGIFFDRFMMDYAISPSRLEPRFHQLTFSYSFDH